MVTLVKDDGKFGIIMRQVRLDQDWPGDVPDGQDDQVRLAGPINLDVYQVLVSAADDDFVGHTVEEVERAGLELNDWTDQQLRAFRSAAWRSAWRFVVNNAGVVDRGREADELAQILKVQP